jgi:predicted DNA-binding transcriptional regulator
MDRIGITENEFKVYEALLASGSSTISSISRRAGLNQRSTYDYIERLIHKGLVGQIIFNNKRMFLALNPDTISHIIDEQKSAAEKEFAGLISIKEAGRDEIAVNQISSKAQFLSLIRKINVDVDIMIGSPQKSLANKDPQHKILQLQDEPSFRLFLKNNRIRKVGKSRRAVIAMFFNSTFLMYSVLDGKGFFVDNHEFSKNMWVYFA